MTAMVPASVTYSICVPDASGSVTMSTDCSSGAYGTSTTRSRMVWTESPLTKAGASSPSRCSTMTWAMLGVACVRSSAVLVSSATLTSRC